MHTRLTVLIRPPRFNWRTMKRGMRKRKHPQLRYRPLGNESAGYEREPWQTRAVAGLVATGKGRDAAAANARPNAAYGRLRPEVVVIVMREIHEAGRMAGD